MLAPSVRYMGVDSRAIAATKAAVAKAIDASPFNRGLSGDEWLAQPSHLAFEAGGNIGLFEDQGGGMWTAHWLLNGTEKLAAAKEMLAALFERHGAFAISGLTPLDCRHGRLFNRWLGGRALGVLPTPHGPCEMFILTRPEWEKKRCHF